MGKLPNITIHDISTDEYTTREMNQEEYAVYQAVMAEEEERQAEAAAKAAQKEALLKKLGITEEDAQLLLGGN